MENIEDKERKIRSANLKIILYNFLYYARDTHGKNFDMILKTNIEGTIVKWGHQVFWFQFENCILSNNAGG